jgi:hypothetical protein
LKRVEFTIGWAISLALGSVYLGGSKSGCGRPSFSRKVCGFPCGGVFYKFGHISETKGPSSSYAQLYLCLGSSLLIGRVKYPLEGEFYLGEFM